MYSTCMNIQYTNKWEILVWNRTHHIPHSHTYQLYIIKLAVKETEVSLLSKKDMIGIALLVLSAMVVVTKSLYENEVLLEEK